MVAVHLRKPSLLYRNSNLPLPASCTDVSKKNSQNDNGLGGVSTNKSPLFYPSQINQESSLKIQHINPQQYLKAGTGSVLLKLPGLPSTSPMHYVLPATGLECKIQLAYPQSQCYSYPEVGWVLIYQIDR